MPKEHFPASPRSETELLGEITGLLREFTANPNHPALMGKPEGNPVQIRPAFPSASEMTARWTAGIDAAGDNYVRGVQAPRANFKTAALANKDAWKAGINKAVAEDAFAKGMQNVNEDEAIAIAVAVGSQGWANGAKARTGKHTRIMGKVAPLMAAAVETVRRKPAVTDADREARAVEMIRAGRAVGKALRGG